MKEARKNNEKNKNEQLPVNLPKTVMKENKIDVRAKLGETVDVSTDTYSSCK